jgi:hypothetical protein
MLVFAPTDNMAVRLKYMGECGDLRAVDVQIIIIFLPLQLHPRDT